MVSQIQCPDNVFALRIEGKITADQIEKIEPQLKRQVEQYEELRLYFEIIDFSYASVEAFWEDLKADFKFLSDCKMIAIATEKEWMGRLSNFLGKITPIEIQIFGLNSRGKAFAWLN